MDISALKQVFDQASAVEAVARQSLSSVSHVLPEAARRADFQDALALQPGSVQPKNLEEELAPVLANNFAAKVGQLESGGTFGRYASPQFLQASEQYLPILEGRLADYRTQLDQLRNGQSVPGLTLQLAENQIQVSEAKITEIKAAIENAPSRLSQLSREASSLYEEIAGSSVFASVEERNQLLARLEQVISLSPDAETQAVDKFHVEATRGELLRMQEAVREIDADSLLHSKRDEDDQDPRFG